TLGYMGTVQARKGNVEAACHTWAQALDAMEGVQSGRAREAAVNMRRVLSPFRNRGISVAAEIDERAKAVLERVADRKSTRLNSSHVKNSYAVFCLKKKTVQRVNI